MSTTFALNAGQFITQAYRKLGVLPSGGAPTDDQLNQGIIALNAMLKGWQADGINLYRQTQIAIAVGANQGHPGNPILITPLVLGVEECRWIVTPAPNLYERPLGPLTYVDYMTLPNKMSSTTSDPSTWTFDKQVNESRLYVFPLPTNGGTINATVGRTVNDVLASTDPVDFPSEWTEGGIYNLADRLMDDEGVMAADPETGARITQRAVAFYQKLLNFDRPTSVMVRPWGKKGTGRFWR